MTWLLRYQGIELGSDKANSLTAGATAKVSTDATDGKYTATFTGLDYGYYVVAVPVRPWPTPVVNTPR